MSAPRVAHVCLDRGLLGAWPLALNDLLNKLAEARAPRLQSTSCSSPATSTCRKRDDPCYVRKQEHQDLERGPCLPEVKIGALFTASVLHSARLRLLAWWCRTLLP